jgi:hypothetical protein
MSQHGTEAKPYTAEDLARAFASVFGNGEEDV